MFSAILLSFAQGSGWDQLLYVITQLPAMKLHGWAMQRKEISLDFLEHMQPHVLLCRFIREIDVLKSSVTALKFFSDTPYLSSAYTLASMVLYVMSHSIAYQHIHWQ